ncbi:MAG: FtsQ-type POTRA domain-containing protein [Patescibacteria group bacterium]|nr:FtsQ-type POTRA domain-containing protein [Patescibacteria group bacterium]
MMIRERTKYHTTGKHRKKIRKDYQHKVLNNPFFRARQKKKMRKNNSRLKIYLFLILSGVILGLLIYFVAFSSFFKIKNIDIEGLERTKVELIRDLVKTQTNKKHFLIFPENNLIFFNVEDLRQVLNQEFRFEEVRVFKRFPKTIKLEIRERNLAFIWRQQNINIFSDNQGCLINEAIINDEAFSKYPILESELEIEYLNPNNCLDLDQQYFNALIELFETLLSHQDLAPARFILSNERNSLIMDLANGPNIIFNTKEDLLKQVNKLIIIRQEQSDDEFLQLEYIDLRFGDLIYFK